MVQIYILAPTASAHLILILRLGPATCTPEDAVGLRWEEGSKAALGHLPSVHHSSVDCLLQGCSLEKPADTVVGLEVCVSSGTGGHRGKALFIWVVHRDMDTDKEWATVILHVTQVLGADSHLSALWQGSVLMLE